MPTISTIYKIICQIAIRKKASVNEFARQALQIFIDQKENENLEKELEVGYKSNYEYYLKSNEEWKYDDNARSLVYGQKFPQPSGE